MEDQTQTQHAEDQLNYLLFVNPVPNRPRAKKKINRKRSPEDIIVYSSFAIGIVSAIVAFICLSVLYQNH